MFFLPLLSLLSIHAWMHEFKMNFLLNYLSNILSDNMVMFVVIQSSRQDMA